MSLVLTLEHAPRPQAVRQTRLDQGQLVIGRSAEADWRIEDPDMFVSRVHCTITGGQGGYVVTDRSSSGLFVDESSTPLGNGNSASIRDGMRLRMGDFVIRVEVEGAVHAPRNATVLAAKPFGASGDDFFSSPRQEEVKAPRPAGLPDPFDSPQGGFFASEPSTPPRPASPAFDDPFSLDPLPTPSPEPQASTAPIDWFSEVEPQPAPAPAPAPKRSVAMPAASKLDYPPAPPSDSALREAFLRGLGMRPEDMPQSAEAMAEMERFGREYRLMIEGLMQLLRKRAEEKGNARVAQTVVQAKGVNPLKFLPTAEDAISTLAAERSQGFLAGEQAISDAVRDLVHHHVSAWRGVQAALRKMIDRFDPASLEEELKSRSGIEKLLAGGRRAKLWELYEQRHREIAESAEQRFLGEVGADFRNAYEQE